MEVKNFFTTHAGKELLLSMKVKSKICVFTAASAVRFLKLTDHLKELILYLPFRQKIVQ